MKPIKISQGVVHTVPKDLLQKLTANNSVLERWEDLTPLARTEWICWCITNKKPETRSKHVERTGVDLLKGKRRPCCWGGCPHRK